MNDKKIDVFAYAMTLYWIAVGKRPWDSIVQLDEIEKLVINGSRPAIPQGVNPLYQRIIESCWSQDPETRSEFSEIVKMIRNNKPS